MDITIKPEELQKSAHKYRKQLLLMLTVGLEESLRHMMPRLGVQYKETAGEYGGNSELGPYNLDRKNGNTKINGRTLVTGLTPLRKTKLRRKTFPWQRKIFMSSIRPLPGSMPLTC